MPYGVKYDSLDNPTISIVGEELPAMWPPDDGDRGVVQRVVTNSE